MKGSNPMLASTKRKTRMSSNRATSFNKTARNQEMSETSFSEIVERRSTRRVQQNNRK